MGEFMTIKCCEMMELASKFIDMKYNSPFPSLVLCFHLLT
jgi:hypothetical protein